MFTNITNQMSQVSSWIGAKKGAEPASGEPGDETKEKSPTAEQPDGAPADAASPTSQSKGSKLEMLSNVKGQMSSWIGNVQVPNVPLPSLFQKNTSENAAQENQNKNVDSPTAVDTQKGSASEAKDDDDNSRLLKVTSDVLKQTADSLKPLTALIRTKLSELSATGGADSDAPADEEEPQDEAKEAGIGGVSTKAVQGAKSIGSFLFSAVNKAGETVSKAGAKIKKTVEENTILGDFNKEQEAFINEKEGKAADAAVPPWVGVPNEEALKEECLSLSTDRRNFVRAPPPGVDFPFDYESSYKVAQAVLAEDPNLEKMRYELVPKIINEENFWRNYFYRISLLRQQAELSAMDAGQTLRASSVEAEPSEEDWEQELEAELKDYEVVADQDNRVDLDSELEDLK